MKGIAFCVGAVALVLSLFCGNAIAGDNEATRNTLKGLEGVRFVLVEYVDKEIIKDASSWRLKIEGDVNRKLHLAEIPFFLSLTDPERFLAMPYLYIRPYIREIGKGMYIVHLTVALKQRVSLLRSPDIMTNAETWSVSSLGVISDLEDIPKTINAMVDEFVNAYLSVNPKE